MIQLLTFCHFVIIISRELPFSLSLSRTVRSAVGCEIIILAAAATVGRPLQGPKGRNCLHARVDMEIQ